MTSSSPVFSLHFCCLVSSVSPVSSDCPVTRGLLHQNYTKLSSLSQSPFMLNKPGDILTIYAICLSSQLSSILPWLYHTNQKGTLWNHLSLVIFPHTMLDMTKVKTLVRYGQNIDRGSCWFNNYNLELTRR